LPFRGIVLRDETSNEEVVMINGTRTNDAFKTLNRGVPMIRYFCDIPRSGFGVESSSMLSGIVKAQASLSVKTRFDNFW